MTASEKRKARRNAKRNERRDAAKVRKANAATAHGRDLAVKEREGLRTVLRKVTEKFDIHFAP